MQHPTSDFETVKASHTPDISREEFMAYEKVRKGGRYNMFDPRARRSTGLSAEKYSAVIKNYSELRAAYMPKAEGSAQ